MKTIPVHMWMYIYFIYYLVILAGKTEIEEKEVDKVMYHDWRLIPKHMEQQLKDFEPLPEPPVRYVHYPPLLRAMILAEYKTHGGALAKEPLLPLKRDVLLSKDYFRKQEQERQRSEGTAVWYSWGWTQKKCLKKSVCLEALVSQFY